MRFSLTPRPKIPQTPQMMVARLLVETVAVLGALAWLTAAPQSLSQTARIGVAAVIGLGLLAVGRPIANAVLARRRR